MADVNKRVEAIAEQLRYLVNEDYDVRLGYANGIIAADPLTDVARQMREALEAAKELIYEALSSDNGPIYYQVVQAIAAYDLLARAEKMGIAPA